VILALAATALIVIWMIGDLNHQQRNLRSLGTLFLTGVALFGWAVFFSRLPKRRRLAIALGGVVLVGAGAALFRIRGVTGDLIPILEPRWARHTTFTDPAATPPVTRAPDPGASNAAPTLATGPAYPGFLGAQRDGTVPALPLARDWTRQPPTLLWRRPLGLAWSGFAVQGRYAITQEQAGGEEAVTALDLSTGQPLWQARQPGHYATVLAGEGPRATPTIAEGRVFAMGALGRLTCLELATGKPLWTRDLVAEHQGKVPEWGISVSPLVTDGLVVVSIGGGKDKSLVAYHAADGTPAWFGGHDGLGYSSPRLAELDGVRQILIFNAHSLAGHNPATGALWWEHPWPAGHPHVAVPTVVGTNRIMGSSGYGYGAELLQIDRDAQGKWQAQRLWRTTRLKAKFANPVFKDGFVYGLDDGVLTCLDPADGQTRWKDGRYGHGQHILCGDLLLLMAESGEVVLIEPKPDALHELARVPVFDHKTWNPPALAGEHLVIRNDLEAACFRLPLARK
jgi:outer membrane protein assembly factor BamB